MKLHRERAWDKRKVVNLGILAVLVSSLGAAIFFIASTLLLGPVRNELSVDIAMVYKNSDVSIDERLQNLLSQMTLAEKIGQMALIEKNSLAQPTDIATYGLGGILSGAGSKPATNTESGWKSLVTDYQTEATKSRLGIPLLYGVDAVHGHALVPGATVFPHQIGLGASGDADLVEAIARATANDIAATALNWNYAPNLDLPTDIRWGRMYEGFSDDPLLTARLGAAYVKGMQTASDSTTTTTTIPVLATLKHFAGVGSMQWNSSTNKNFKIDQGVTLADTKALQKKYLPPFKAAIDTGVLSVMVGLHTWGNSKLIVSREIITGELKDRLAFKGFVVSDWYGVYEGAGNKFIATVRAINAGVDMVMLPFDYKTFVRQVTWANRLGIISDARIDDAVSRILRAKFTAGLFDVPVATEVKLADNRALARTAVAQSLVLLKNNDALLPLKKNPRHIRVAGRAADNIGIQSGAWTVEWQGVDGNWLPNATSILAGIRAQVTPGTNVEYSPTGEYKTAGTKAPIGIAIVGETPYAEGWGDREYPILSEADLQAIKNLQAVCDQVVVVIVSGRPLLIANEVDSWDALVAAWLPGTEGGGVTDVLFGDKQFMGTLPVPWPKTAEQLPVATDGATRDGTALLFPRYSGLSY